MCNYYHLECCAYIFACMQHVLARRRARFFDSPFRLNVCVFGKRGKCLVGFRKCCASRQQHLLVARYWDWDNQFSNDGASMHVYIADTLSSYTYRSRRLDCKDYEIVFNVFFMCRCVVYADIMLMTSGTINTRSTSACKHMLINS